jgi:hypothetical protein
VARQWTDTEAVRYFLQKYRRATIAEAVEAAAQEVREPLLHGTERFCSIPVDLGEVARRVGVKTGGHLEPNDHRLGVLSLEAGAYTVRTAPGGTNRQERFTLAHEIGHRLFRDGLRHSIESPSVKEKDAEDRICEMFASALLMPASYMPSIVEHIPGGEPWDILLSLEQAARRFDVSLPAMVFRIGQFQSRKGPALIIMCLSHFANRFTRTQPCLRVWVCASTSKGRSPRTWYNRSAEGLGMVAANQLFSQWSEASGHNGESTGGRYALDDAGRLARASREVLRWMLQQLRLSILVDGAWQKCALQCYVANCLYARRGSTISEAYILSIVKEA